MSDYIVTGGCGFIGGHLVDRLVLDGHNVTVIDDLSAPENNSFHYNKGAKYFKQDISKSDCSSHFSGADCVFHLAARSRIQPTIGSPSQCFEVNVIGTQRVLEWCRLYSIKRLIYSGHQLYGIESLVLRYFNVFGPREPLKGRYAPVIGLFKRQNKYGNPMTIVGDGEQRRDFTYISDVVEANIMAEKSDIKFGIYNVGTGKNYSINEIANFIGDHKIYVDERPAEVRETLADIESTIQDIGWKPKHDLSHIINQY